MVARNIFVLRQPLAGLKPQSAGWAALLSLTAAATYLGCFVGAGFVESFWPRLACALALGPLIALLFRIAHDCGHESHFTGRRLNQIVGRLSNLPAYHAYSLWILFHNWRHHTFTNLKTRDYIWVPLSRQEFDQRSRFGRALERFYRTSLGVGAYYLCAIWMAKMIVPRRTFVQKIRRIHVLDSLLVLGFFCAQLGVLSIGAAGPGDFATRMLLAIVLPFLIYNWMVGFVSFLNHTHPDIPWFARRDEWSFYTGQVHCTAHTSVPRWMIFFVTDIGLHGAHHIEPRIPIWGLEQAEQRIVADAHDDLVLERWTYRRHREIMRRCKLYDYDSHRWLDYAGRPTGAPIIAALPAA
jgi:omega-6 fatty acid desaturase (delta-12 desaturase)